MNDLNDNNNNNNVSSNSKLQLIYPQYSKCSHLKLSYRCFIPKKKLVYCFFGELCIPNEKLLKSSKHSIFGLEKVSDVQRFCYYPGTDYIYTFIGFNDNKKREEAMSKESLTSSAINHKIFIYPLQNLASSTNQESFKVSSLNKINNYKNSQIDRFHYTPEEKTNKNNATTKDSSKKSKTTSLPNTPFKPVQMAYELNNENSNWLENAPIKPDQITYKQNVVKLDSPKRTIFQNAPIKPNQITYKHNNEKSQSQQNSSLQMAPIKPDQIVYRLNNEICTVNGSISNQYNSNENILFKSETNDIQICINDNSKAKHTQQYKKNIPNNTSIFSINEENKNANESDDFDENKNTKELDDDIIDDEYESIDTIYINDEKNPKEGNINDCDNKKSTIEINDEYDNSNEDKNIDENDTKDEDDLNRKDFITEINDDFEFNSEEEEEDDFDENDPNDGMDYTD